MPSPDSVGAYHVGLSRRRLGFEFRSGRIYFRTNDHKQIIRNEHPGFKPALPAVHSNMPVS